MIIPVLSTGGCGYSIDKQIGDGALTHASMPGRHRPPTGAPNRTNVRLGGEGTPAGRGLSTSGGPKTLKERLQWMADNLPGFAVELRDIDAIQLRALSRRG